MWGQKYGWERPNFFAGEGVDTTETLESMYTFDKPAWLEPVGKEVHACRNDVVVFDVTSFCKIAVEGPDACRRVKHIFNQTACNPKKKKQIRDVCFCYWIPASQHLGCRGSQPKHVPNTAYRSLNYHHGFCFVLFLFCF